MTEDAFSDLSDFEFEERLQDPAIIETHEEAQAIILELTSDIARIRTQLAEYREREAVRPPTEENREWHRRAIYAAHAKEQQRWLVVWRDQELRKSANAERQCKQEQAAAQRAQAHAKLMEIQSRKTLAVHFLEAARDLLPMPQYAAIYRKAELRREVAIRKSKATNEGEAA